MRIEKLQGRRFGSLVVVKLAGGLHYGSAWWLCRCDCSATTTVTTVNLREGKVSDCGCKRHAQPKTAA